MWPDASGFGQMTNTPPRHMRLQAYPPDSHRYLPIPTRIREVIAEGRSQSLVREAHPGGISTRGLRG